MRNKHEVHALQQQPQQCVQQRVQQHYRTGTDTRWIIALWAVHTYDPARTHTHTHRTPHAPTPTRASKRYRHQALGTRLYRLQSALS